MPEGLLFLLSDFGSFILLGTSTTLLLFLLSPLGRIVTALFIFSGKCSSLVLHIVFARCLGGVCVEVLFFFLFHHLVAAYRGVQLLPNGSLTFDRSVMDLI